MRLKLVAATFATFTALACMAAPADAQTRERRITYDARGHTVLTTRDEDGRTRTRVIIQKRSYLDPGTETSPGESEHNYAFSATDRPTSVLDNTPFGGNQSALPGPFDLPSRNAPFLRF
ncbi:MAG TPA: hypothetical protein VFC54_01805 [Pseudolabrys sp.]|nr:hypothetical protein [Pseudolabrys sp.]